MSRTYETILVNTRDGITTLTLNRPEKMNPINPTMVKEITEVMDEIAYDERYRVLVITGAGAAFCSGIDLNWGRSPEALSNPWAAHRFYGGPGTEGILGLQEKLRLFPLPTIAAVNGWAFALGFWMAMLCDCVVIARDAHIGVPEMQEPRNSRMSKTHPGGGTVTSMAFFVPHRFALWHLFTGEDITGEEAERLLMVNKAVPAGQLMEEAYKLAERMKKVDPLAFRVLKRSYWRAKNSPYSVDTLELEHMEQSEFASLRQAVGKSAEPGIRQ